MLFGNTLAYIKYISRYMVSRFDQKVNAFLAPNTSAKNFPFCRRRDRRDTSASGMHSRRYKFFSFLFVARALLSRASVSLLLSPHEPCRRSRIASYRCVAQPRVSAATGGRLKNIVVDPPIGGCADARERAASLPPRHRRRQTLNPIAYKQTIPNVS